MNREHKVIRGVMAAVAAALIAWGLCGCEDDSGDTVYEAQDIVVGSNSQVIVVEGNSGVVEVNQLTSPDKKDPSIYILRNTGRVDVSTAPLLQETGEDQEAETP